jgi:hypothetical protein
MSKIPNVPKEERLTIEHGSGIGYIGLFVVILVLFLIIFLWLNIKLLVEQVF